MATARSRLALLLLLGASSAVLAQRSIGAGPFGQQQQPPPQIPPESSIAPLKVTTQLTLESVTVVDAAGKPVLGLKLSDFSIKEDGKPQKIKNFEEYGSEITSQQPFQPAPPPALPPHVYTNAQSTGPQSGAVNILLLDMLNTGPARQEVVKKAAIAYLQKMPAGTEIAIFVLGRELHVVQGFTTDPAVLLAAVTSYQPNTAIDQATVYSPIPLPSAGCITCRLVQRACDVLNTRSSTTLDALDAIAAFGSEIKGRKNLLWFTTGLPQITAFNWVYNTLTQLSDGAVKWVPSLVDYGSNLQRAYGLLAAAQVVVYPIDPRGLGDSHAGDVGELNIGGLEIEEMPQYIRNANASIKEIAENTGGLAYYDRNDLDAAIGEVINNGAHSYSLSYVPPFSKQGKYHKVEIAVDRPSLHLQYRENYTTVELSKALAETKATDNAPALDEGFHSAVDQDVLPSAGVIFYVRVLPSTAPAKPGDPPIAEVLNAKFKGKPLVRYTLTCEMPPGEVTLVDGKGSLEFDVVAYGVLSYGEGPTKLNVVRESVNFTLKPNQVDHFVNNPVAIPVQIDLPPGKLNLHTGVLDVNSQKMGTLEIPETVTSKQ